MKRPLPRKERALAPGSSSERADYESSEVRDELLMVRYQRGDRKAFAALARRHRVRLYNFIRRFVRNTSAAEELTQEVFLRVVQRSAHFKHEARFAAWLYAIARNVCIDHLRKQKLRNHASLDQPTRGSEQTPLGDTIEDPHPSSSVERSVAANAIGQSLVRAIEELPEEQKEVFLLREIANLPFKDIAEVTDCGENTVKSRMRYALQHLQRALAEFEHYSQELN